MERRFLKQDAASINVESRDDEAPKIVGYAARFYDGTPDTEYELWQNTVERIMPGTFDRALKETDDARALFNHDANMLLGRVSAGTVRLSADKDGLRYEIEPGDTSVARDVLEHIRRGDLQGSSFSFRVTDEEWRKEDGVEIREITGVELFDVGPVTYPAYESTTTDVRSDDAQKAYDAWKKQESDQRAEETRLANRLRQYQSRAVEVESVT